MKMTTIAIPMKLKETLAEYGLKGESYAQIIERLCRTAEDKLLNDLIFNKEGFISIEEALEEANEKWPGSK